MTSTQEGLPRPCVALPQGKIEGFVQTDHFPQPVECFLGFPYAEPPVGDLRFRPPVKVKPSNITIEAVAYGKAAPGKPLIPPRIPLVYSEDCLTANVIRPIRRPGDTQLLPVAVYIHGGAFNRGHSSSQNTASMVAWSEEPFVAVSFNYRIGALGFLASSKAAEEGILNLGMQDQRLLLDWIQENIYHFGGDKHNVTLIGLSAGAITVSLQPRTYKGIQCLTLVRRLVILCSTTVTETLVRFTGSSWSLGHLLRGTAGHTMQRSMKSTSTNSWVGPGVHKTSRLQILSNFFAPCLCPPSLTPKKPSSQSTSLPCSGLSVRS